MNALQKGPHEQEPPAGAGSSGGNGGSGGTGGFDPGIMTDGSDELPPGDELVSGEPAGAGEEVDPTGGSADGGEAGQDAGSMP